MPRLRITADGVDLLASGRSKADANVDVSPEEATHLVRRGDAVLPERPTRRWSHRAPPLTGALGARLVRALAAMALLALASSALAANTMTGFDVSTSTQVVTRLPFRVSILIQNTGTVDAYCSLSTPATASNGYLVKANGGSWHLDFHEDPTQPVYCYATSTTHLVVGEWYSQ